MLLEMKNINKSFPGVRANRDVCINVEEGEIHSLLGENGAGKSTLMNILYGLYVPDSGSILWQGKPIDVANTKEAIDLGIGMIHQHFMLIPKFTVVENIILGTWEGLNPKLALDEAAEKIIKLSEAYGKKIDPWAVVENLSVGEQQRVEIIKALYRDVRLLIMDEPTAVLTPQEVEELFKTLAILKKENRSVIFISHKLDEVLRVSDRITILRDGSCVASLDCTSDLDKGKLAHMLVGRDVSLEVDKTPYQGEDNEVVLSLDQLRLQKFIHKGESNSISLDIHRGEIFGIAGVDGNGQEELAASILGIEKLAGGKIKINGIDTTHWTTPQIRQLSLAYIPEDRFGTGLVLDFTVQENLVLNTIDRPAFKNLFGMKFRSILSNAVDKIKKFNIFTPGPNTIVKKLSGGNQQKVVLARETGQPVDLIIAVQPTRGLDVDATRFVYDTMLAARDAGAAVLYISTELEEIMGLSDTIGVLFSGELIGTVPANIADLKTIGLLMAGERVNMEEGFGL